jgi:hypothetical protein
MTRVTRLIPMVVFIIGDMSCSIENRLWHATCVKVKLTSMLMSVVDGGEYGGGAGDVVGLCA